MSERYVIELEAIAGAPWRGVSGQERLKRLLKSSLRSYGLRCVSATPAPTRVVFRAVEDGVHPSNRGPFEP